jgi:hypothetical protein
MPPPPPQPCANVWVLNNLTVSSYLFGRVSADIMRGLAGEGTSRDALTLPKNSGADPDTNHGSEWPGPHSLGVSAVPPGMSLPCPAVRAQRLQVEAPGAGGD